MGHRRTPARSGSRRYPRTARLNALYRQIVADELDRIQDDRLEWVTVTGIDVDRDLRHARVFFDCLDGGEGDEAALEALSDSRVRLQAAIGREARVKRVPELAFSPDPAIRSGERIDAILREVSPEGAFSSESEPSGSDDVISSEGLGEESVSDGEGRERHDG